MAISKLRGRRLDNIFNVQRVRQLRNVHQWKKILNAFSNNAEFNSQSSLYNHPAEKVIKYIVYIAAILGMLVMIVDGTIAFKSSPTVTTTETNSYPVQKIDYPAIAICSINRISRAAATNLAEELMEFETTTYNVNLTVDDLTDMLQVMGHLYLFDTNDDHEKITLLHTILERGYNGYDVGRIMKRLTPKCRTLIKKCSWEGKDQVCEDIFFLRKTESGYCCTFNYVRRNDGFGSSQNGIFVTQQIERSTNIGSEYGLSVLLNPQLDDYVYEILPTQGFKIFIYTALDYPDVLSGGVQEVLIPPKTDNFLDLDAIAFYSIPEVRQHDILKRDCLFSDEQSKIFHGHYSFSDCIIHCRTKDILELCKCIPFFHPIADDTASAKVCNLKDLSCLKKYKDRWQRLKPRYEDHMEPFVDDKFAGNLGYLNCDCLPSCEDVMYTVSVSSIPLTLSDLFWGRKNILLKNHSTVHIFFGKSGAMRLRQDVLFYWYELMSNYGGICSFFLGISIITLVEILYNGISAICSTRNSSVEIEKITVQSTPETREAPTNISTETASGIKTLQETSILYWSEITRSVKQKEFLKLFPEALKSPDT